MATGAFTLYFYDTDPTERDPQFQTNNNRLLRYEEYGPSAPNVLLRTVFYTYYKTGHVSNITIKDESSPNERRDLALTYSRAGHLWLALRGKWAVDPLIPQLWPNDPGTYASGTYTRDDAFEFRYDSGRQRYLWRQVDTTTFDPLPSPNDINHWTDYVGDDPWGDFDNTSGSSTATEITRYLPGFGSQGKQVVSGGAIDHFMGDLIRSTVLTTDSSGSSTGTQVYTAFGEPVGTATTDSERYHYAGGWGYESGLLLLLGANTLLPPITFQRVATLWYQPDAGRFLQSGPIGVGDGTDSYTYGLTNPLALLDTSDLDLDIFLGGGGGAGGGGGGSSRPPGGYWKKMEKIIEAMRYKQFLEKTPPKSILRRLIDKILPKKPPPGLPIIAAITCGYFAGEAAGEAVAPHLRDTSKGRDRLESRRAGLDDAGHNEVWGY